MDRISNLQKAPRLRRPSISDQTSFLRDDDQCSIRRSTAIRRSTVRGSNRLSGLVTSTSGRVSKMPKDENEESDQLAALRTSSKESPKDYEKILSIQYMINFDQIFISDYSLRDATLSSIELMKQKIAEKYESVDRRYSQSDLASDQTVEQIADRQKFKKLRRQKLLDDVWNKQHRYRTTFKVLKKEMSTKWMEYAQSSLSDINPDRALIGIEKYLFYNPGMASAYIMKSVAFQLKGDLRMASIAIKTAEEMGLSEQDQAGLSERLAQIEFNQAEKFREKGEFREAFKHYSAAHSIIPNFEDCPVRIINIEFETGNTDNAMRLLDEQIECQPDRLELRVRRTAQLLKMNRLDVCHNHLDRIAEIDPENVEMRRMRNELETRGKNHETNCLMFLAANHIKDALLQVELAIGARPRLLRLYLLRAKVYRRLKLWEQALSDLELLYSAGIKELNEDCNKLIFCILNDFGVDCIRTGSYRDAIVLFNAALLHVDGERKIFLNRGDCWLRIGQSELALRDYSRALSLCLHEPSCRLIRGRISVVHHEMGSKAYLEGNYKEAEHHFSLAIEYQVAALYLIHRARARIMIGNDNLAKVDAITAYKLDPQSPELVPVLARLFPDASIPEVELYQHRFFPEIENPNKSNKKQKQNKTLTDVQTKKTIEKKNELISIGEMRAYLVNQSTGSNQPLPPIKSTADIQYELTKSDGWKQFNIGISNF